MVERPAGVKGGPHPGAGGSGSLRLPSQHNSYVETLKPRAASATEIAAMLEARRQRTDRGREASGLNKLRFERLLSDEQFEAAKARILGLPQGV